MTYISGEKKEIANQARKHCGGVKSRHAKESERDFFTFDTVRSKNANSSLRFARKINTLRVQNGHDREREKKKNAIFQLGAKMLCFDGGAISRTSTQTANQATLTRSQLVRMHARELFPTLQGSCRRVCPRWKKPLCSDVYFILRVARFASRLAKITARDPPPF